MKPNLGEPLVARVAEKCSLPLETARTVIVEVLTEVAADLRRAIPPLGEMSDVGHAARTLALRVDYAIERIAPSAWASPGHRKKAGPTPPERP